MKLRWVAVVVPTVVIGILDLVTDHEWTDLVTAPFNTLMVPLLGLAGAIVFAGTVFRRIDRLAAEVHERDAELARAAAVQGERERIAREMHDGLAQVLGYVNTKAQAVEGLLANGHTDEARRQLAELSAAARSVYVDVREAILGLTNPVSANGGLVTALEEYAARFSDASKLAVSVNATAAARELRLAPEAESQIFRIVQEALTNVRKHAAARRVDLAVAVAANELVLTVIDDGVGLAPHAVPADWPHYGMQGMRSRAAAIGATVDWTSVDEGGTRFTLSVPACPRIAVAS